MVSGDQYLLELLPMCAVARVIVCVWGVVLCVGSFYLRLTQCDWWCRLSVSFFSCLPWNPVLSIFAPPLLIIRPNFGRAAELVDIVGGHWPT